MIKPELFCRYSPAILLLRHFDVLRNLASSEGLQCDHTGLVSEIASVIRKFTQAVVMAEENSYEEKLNGVPVSIFISNSWVGKSLYLLYYIILYMRCGSRKFSEKPHSPGI